MPLATAIGPAWGLTGVTISMGAKQPAGSASVVETSLSLTMNAEEAAIAITSTAMAESHPTMPNSLEMPVMALPTTVTK